MGADSNDLYLLSCHQLGFARAGSNPVSVVFFSCPKHWGGHCEPFRGWHVLTLLRLWGTRVDPCFRVGDARGVSCWDGTGGRASPSYRRHAVIVTSGGGGLGWVCSIVTLVHTQVDPAEDARTLTPTGRWVPPRLNRRS